MVDLKKKNVYEMYKRCICIMSQLDVNRVRDDWQH